MLLGVNRHVHRQPMFKKFNLKQLTIFFSTYATQAIIFRVSLSNYPLSKKLRNIQIAN